MTKLLPLPFSSAEVSVLKHISTPHQLRSAIFHSSTGTIKEGKERDAEHFLSHFPSFFN